MKNRNDAFAHVLSLLILAALSCAGNLAQIVAEVKPNSFTVSWQVAADAGGASTPKLILVIRPQQAPNWRPSDGTDYALSPDVADRSVSGETVQVSFSQARAEQENRVVVVDAAIDFKTPSLSGRKVELALQGLRMGTAYEVTAWLQKVEGTARTTTYVSAGATKIVTYLGGMLLADLELRSEDSPYRISEDLILVGSLGSSNVTLLAEAGVNIRVSFGSLLVLDRSILDAVDTEANWGSLVVEEGGDLSVLESEISGGGSLAGLPVPQIIIRSSGSPFGPPVISGSEVGFSNGDGILVDGGAVDITSTESENPTVIADNGGAGLVLRNVTRDSILDGLILDENDGAGLVIGKLKTGVKLTLDNLEVTENREGVVVSEGLDPASLIAGPNLVLLENNWQGTPSGSANLVIRAGEFDGLDLLDLVVTFDPRSLFFSPPGDDGFTINEGDSWPLFSLAGPDVFGGIKSVRIGSGGLLVLGKLDLIGEVTILMDDSQTDGADPAGIIVGPGGSLTAVATSTGGAVFTGSSGGEWDGIQFIEGSEGNLRRATLEWGRSIWDDSMLSIASSQVRVSQSKIGPTSGHGVFIYNAHPTFDDNFVIDCRKHGVLAQASGDVPIVLRGNYFSKTNGFDGFWHYEAVAADARFLYKIVTPEGEVTQYVVDAKSNYWGHASGPEHPLNPDGTGAWVGLNVAFDPWIGKSQEPPPDPGKFGAPLKPLANAAGRPWHSTNVSMTLTTPSKRNPGVRFIGPLNLTSDELVLVSISPDRPSSFVPRRHSAEFGAGLYDRDFLHRGRVLIRSHLNRAGVDFRPTEFDFYEPGRRYHFASWKARQVPVEPAGQNKRDWVFEPLPGGSGFFVAALPTTITDTVEVKTHPGNYPVPVIGYVSVNPGGHLIIEPGTTLKFVGDYGIFVQGGRLSADDAVFTVAADDSIGGDNQNDGSDLASLEDHRRTWNGMTLQSSAHVTNCRFHYLRLPVSIYAQDVVLSDNELRFEALGKATIPGQGTDSTYNTGILIERAGLGGKVTGNRLFDAAIRVNSNPGFDDFKGPYGVVANNEILLSLTNVSGIYILNNSMTVTNNLVRHQAGLPTSISIGGTGLTSEVFHNGVRFFLLGRASYLNFGHVVINSRVVITNSSYGIGTSRVTSDYVYLIGGFTVTSGGQVTMGSNVRVLGHIADQGIVVESGGLLTARKSIFTSIGDTAVAPAVFPAGMDSLRRDKERDGIAFQLGASGLLEACVIRHGAVPVRDIDLGTRTIFGLNPQVFIESSNVRIHGCDIEQNPVGPTQALGGTVQGIMIQNASPSIISNRISVISSAPGPNSACILTYKSTPTIQYNILSTCVRFCSGVIAIETRAGLLPAVIDARSNSWSSVTGPYHPTNNPAGGGVGVSSAVLFDPWLEKIPLPPIVTPPPDMVVEATGLTTPVILGKASAIDLVDGPIATVQPTPASPKSPFKIGRYEIEWSAQDKEGNVGTAKQVVVVQDTLPPLVTPPPPVRVNTTRVPVEVNLGVATALDRVTSPVIPRPGFSGPFGEGYHEVIWIGTDGAGNIGTARQTLVVVVGDGQDTNTFAAPRILSITPLNAGRSMELTWQGLAGYLDEIEGSSDLRQWSPATATRLEGGQVLRHELTLTNAPPRTQFFYRIKRSAKTP